MTNANRTGNKIMATLQHLPMAKVQVINGHMVTRVAPERYLVDTLQDDWRGLRSATAYIMSPAR